MLMSEFEFEALIMVKVIDDYIHMKKEVFVCYVKYRER